MSNIHRQISISILPMRLYKRQNVRVVRFKLTSLLIGPLNYITCTTVESMKRFPMVCSISLRYRFCLTVNRRNGCVLSRKRRGCRWLQCNSISKRTQDVCLLPGNQDIRLLIRSGFPEITPRDLMMLTQ